MLKRSRSMQREYAGVSAITTSKLFIGFIADASAVTARHLPIKAHVPFQQVSRDQILYSRSCKRHCVIPLHEDQGGNW